MSAERAGPAASNAAAGEGRLEALLAAKPVSVWRRVAWLLMLLLVALGAWAYFAELDEVAIAEGEFVPQGNVKVVQHFEGGIIQEIHVAEGAMVKAGDPLVLLGLGVSQLNAAELRVRLDGLRLRRARLAAEAGGRALVLPPDIAKRWPKLAAGERQAYEARKSELESTLAGLGEQVLQRKLAVKELQAARRTLVVDLGLARQSLAMSKDLLAEGLTAKMEHLKHRREVKRLEGEIAAITPSIPRAKAAFAEARARLAEEGRKVRRQASEALGELALTIARTEELVITATEQADRTLIRSPIDGVVKNLRYHTIGGVVRPGEPLMEVVPSGGKLVVEARLRPVDRGYVRVGQPATVKVSTFEFIRYGGLVGQVVHIGADSNTGADGNPYFRVIVETEKSYLGDDPAQLRVTPGMQATVDIRTGTRSVGDYLVRPVLKLRHEAFRER